MQRDLVRQATLVVLGRIHALLGDGPEHVVGVGQRVDAVLHVAARPEALLRLQELAAQAGLVPDLGQHDVPGRQRHDDQDHQGTPGDDVAVGTSA